MKQNRIPVDLELYQSELPLINNSFTFADIFSGIGGFRSPFEEVGGRCVASCEWDSACRATYSANFDCQHPFFSDINLVDMEDVPQYDLLLAGFPCQPFSIAGVSKNNSLGRPHGFLCESQGTLFFKIAQMIQSHKPQAFLLENVKNLLRHDKGRTFSVIMKTLTEELGYHVTYRVIDARYWVPQHRERIYIVGFREATEFSFDRIDVPREQPNLAGILHPENGKELTEEPYTLGVKAIVNPKYTLSDHLWNYLQDYAARQKAKGNGFGYGLFGPDDVARTLSARYYKDGSEILIKQERNNPRRLTPRECARLMGFRGQNGSEFTIPVSDTQAYKQFGNSVVVPVIRAIANEMTPFLGDRHVQRRSQEEKL